MLAKEIMRRRVFTVKPEMTLREAARLFIDRQITGAPVLDADGRLVGVLSQTDIVRRDREVAPEAEVPGYYREGEKALYTSGYQIEDPDFTKVGDVMTPAVLSAGEDATIEELGRLMLKRHIHRVIITKGGRLSGIVTTMDMLRGLLEGGRHERTRRPDLVP